MNVTYNALPISLGEELVYSDKADLKAYVDKMTNRIDDVAGEDGEPLEWNDGLRAQLP